VLLIPCLADLGGPQDLDRGDRRLAGVRDEPDPQVPVGYVDILELMNDSLVGTVPGCRS
jgi:hypothetical protein